jgi:hypothetical protein
MCYENEKGRMMGYSTLGIMCASCFGWVGGGSARIIDIKRQVSKIAGTAVKKW